MVKGYLIKMSVGKWEVPIDESELPKVLNAIENTLVVKVKSGIIRGNLIAGILPDLGRKMTIERFKEGKKYNEFIPLKDMFSGLKLPSGEIKKLL